MASHNMMLRGMSFLNPTAFHERGWRDALRVLDAAGIRRGVLLSEAYLISSPMLDRDRGSDVARLVREENAFNVAAALSSGGRLVAFVGINPLAANALDELRFWAGKPGVSGVKLHLANSGFNPRSPEMVATLADFVDAARRAKMPLVVHVRSGSDYSRRDAEVFIEQVLSRAGDLPVQIAHAGGWGGIDEPTLDALQSYRDAIARHAPGTRNLSFDLAVVVLWPKTDPESLRRLATLMRQIGLDRFLMGSDWPARATPGDYNKLLESQLPLTRAEWIEVLGNRSPVLASGQDIPRTKRRSRS